MLSIAKQIKDSIFSLQHYSKLQNLLSSNTNSKQSSYNNKEDEENGFVDIILDAGFDKKGKIISLN